MSSTATDSKEGKIERRGLTGTAFRTGSVVPAPQRKQTIALSAISVPQLLHRIDAAYQKAFTTRSCTVAGAAALTAAMTACFRSFSSDSRSIDGMPCIPVLSIAATRYRPGSNADDMNNPGTGTRRPDGATPGVGDVCGRIADAAMAGSARLTWMNGEPWNQPLSSSGKMITAAPGTGSPRSSVTMPSSVPTS